MVNRREAGFTIFELLGVLVIYSFVSYFLFSAMMSLKEKQQYEMMRLEITTFQTDMMDRIMNDFKEYNPYIITRDFSDPLADPLTDDPDTFTFEAIYPATKEWTLFVDVDNNQITYNEITYNMPEGCNIMGVSSNYSFIINDTGYVLGSGEPAFLKIDIEIEHTDIEGNFGFNIIYQIANTTNLVINDPE